MKIQLTHKDTGKVVTGEQYIQGQHPPPKGVKVSMGQRGVLARVTTARGELQSLNSTDWLVDVPELGKDIFTDTFVRDMYTVEDHETPSDPDKPLKLG